MLKRPGMKTIPVTILAALSLAACGKSTASVADIEKLKNETCACQDKACAEAANKKAESMLTDDAIREGGDKAMGYAFDIAACLAKFDVK